MPSKQSTMHVLDLARFDEFIAYLDDHLSDNGAPGTPYFQPLARAQSGFPRERAEHFRNALSIPVGQPGWRRAWLARAPDGRVAGHVDLRAHGERYAAHRCLLGMGVGRDFRRAGLGARLMAHAQRWAEAKTALEWIDLNVLSSNAPALALYRAAGFTQVGEIADMFKIDGQLFSYTSMAKRLARAAGDENLLKK